MTLAIEVVAWWFSWTGVYVKAELGAREKRVLEAHEASGSGEHKLETFSLFSVWLVRK